MRPPLGPEKGRGVKDEQKRGEKGAETRRKGAKTSRNGQKEENSV